MVRSAVVDVVYGLVHAHGPNAKFVFEGWSLYPHTRTYFALHVRSKRTYLLKYLCAQWLSMPRRASEHLHLQVSPHELPRSVRAQPRLSSKLCLRWMRLRLPLRKDEPLSTAVRLRSRTSLRRWYPFIRFR